MKALGIIIAVVGVAVSALIAVIMLMDRKRPDPQTSQTGEPTAAEGTAGGQAQELFDTMISLVRSARQSKEDAAAEQAGQSEADDAASSSGSGPTIRAPLRDKIFASAGGSGITGPVA